MLRIPVISYAQLDDATARTYRPGVVHVDAANRIVVVDAEPAHLPTATRLAG
jgi:aspartate 1-decarboxylase